MQLRLVRAALGFCLWCGTGVVGRRRLQSEAQEAAHALELEDSRAPNVIKDAFKHLPNLVDVGTSESQPCPPPLQDPPRTEVLPGGQITLTVLRPRCFTSIRNHVGLPSDFATSLANMKQVGSGSGFSGAQHFLSKDGRYYMKGLPNKLETAVLLEGTFLSDFAEHVATNPSTLLVHLYALIKVEVYESMFAGTQEKWLLVMDNTKRSINMASQSFLAFDLKGSKWKHRIMRGAGRRCNPFFALSFYSGAGGAAGPFQAEGEDNDFIALRTHSTRSGSQDLVKKMRDAMAANASSAEPWMRRLVANPIHDECLAPPRKWIAAQAADSAMRGKEYNFCEKLVRMVEAVKERAADSGLDVRSKKLGHANWCSNWLEGRLRWDENVEWLDFVREEKNVLEGMRSFFGYPSRAGSDLSLEPLGVQPGLRNRLLQQIDADVALLRRHELLDYSMDLVIKYDSDAPDCRAMAAVESEAAASSGPGSIFEQYKGGIRAVGVDGDAEKAVYVMRIMDFLSQWGTKKRVSRMLQRLVAQDKPDLTLSAESVKHLSELIGPSSCAGGSFTAPFCWSGCSDVLKPQCPGDMHASKLEPVAVYDLSFVGLVAGSSARCSMQSDIGFRTLCAVVPRQWEGDLRQIMPKLNVSSSVPPHIELMSDEELSSYLARSEVKEALARLHHVVLPLAPAGLKRIALMIYHDIARRPIGEDTAVPADYASRFTRYFESWIQAPARENFERQCPASGSLLELVRAPFSQ